MSLIKKVKGPFPTDKQLAKFEKSLPEDLPRGLGKVPDIRADKRNHPLSISRHRRKFGIAQKSSDKLRPIGYISN
jgi:hypothetical protein